MSLSLIYCGLIDEQTILVKVKHTVQVILSGLSLFCVSCVYIIVIERPVPTNIATVIKRSLCCNKVWDKVEHYSIKIARTLAFGLK